ncbi:MAG: twin-arginine translocase TatA/TatE family subunit [Alphaproteobacteria bacterium]|nr:twin-arginine translocase TatA/TatE family subunit [Alphaproteobacteria bacterium]
MGLSMGHLILLLVIVLVIFGAGKIPQIMGDMAKGLKAFKDGMKEEDKKSSPREDHFSDEHHVSTPHDRSSSVTIIDHKD